MKSPTPKPMSRSRTLLVFGLLLLLFAFALVFHLIGVFDLTGEGLSTAMTGLVMATIGFAMRLVTTQPIGREEPSDER
jgi:hypothetical protein